MSFNQMNSNKNIRQQRSARAARLKIKLDTTHQQMQPLQNLYFEIPLPPNTHISATQNNYTSTPATIVQTPLDERKEHIKQKIKFRVKQELWNLLKKNNDKGGVVKTTGSESPVIPRKKTSNLAFVMGTSSTKFARNQENTRKNWYRSMSENKPRTAEKERSFLMKEGQGGGRMKHRRGWSSVKMREKDLGWLAKNQIRANRSAVHMDRVEMFNIEPWHGGEDPESQEL